MPLGSPDRSPGPHAPGAASSSPTAGDGIKVNVVEARGAQKTGAIWILVISLALAVAALGAYWVLQAPRLQAVNHPSGRDLNVKDVDKLYAAPQSATHPAAAR